MERSEIAHNLRRDPTAEPSGSRLRDLAQAEAGQLRLAMAPVVVWQDVDANRRGFAPVAEGQGTKLVVAASAALASTDASPAGTSTALWVLAGARPSRPSAPQPPPTPCAIPPKAAKCESISRKRPRGLGDLEVYLVSSRPASGISPADLAHVFDRFWSRTRSTDGRTSTDAGSGLGLAITKYLVEAQGGEIGVGGKPDGGGTRFWLTF